jgi:hypothetical protein
MDEIKDNKIIFPWYFCQFGFHPLSSMHIPFTLESGGRKLGLHCAQVIDFLDSLPLAM